MTMTVVDRPGEWRPTRFIKGESCDLRQLTYNECVVADVDRGGWQVFEHVEGAAVQAVTP